MESKKRWKPKEGEQYWLCFGERVQSFYWYNYEADNKSYEYGNCFQTQEEAEEVVEKFKQLLKEHHDGK